MFKVIGKFGLISLAATNVFAGMSYGHHETDSLPLTAIDAADQCQDGVTQIKVNVSGASHEGIAKIELYKPEDNWLKDETRKVRVPAEGGVFTVCLTVEPGTYAIAGYHDQNANRKLDKKFPFKPKEPFGVVNQDRLTKKKRPKFKQVSFVVGEGGSVVDLILVDPKDD